MPVPKFNPRPPTTPLSVPMPGLAGGVVVPSDTVNFPTTAAYLYITTTGTLSVVMGGVTVSFGTVPVGRFDVACTRVNATGTSAAVLAFAG